MRRVWAPITPLVLIIAACAVPCSAALHAAAARLGVANFEPEAGVHAFVTGGVSDEETYHLGEGLLNAVAGAIGSMAKHHGTVDRLHDLARRKPKHIEEGAASFFLETSSRAGAGDGAGAKAGAGARAKARISARMDAAAAAHLHDALHRAAVLTGMREHGGASSPGTCSTPPVPSPPEGAQASQIGGSMVSASMDTVFEDPSSAAGTTTGGAADDAEDDRIDYSASLDNFRQRLEVITAVKESYSSPCRKTLFTTQMKENPHQAWSAIIAEFEEFVMDEAGAAELNATMGLVLAGQAEPALAKLLALAASEEPKIQERIKQLELKITNKAADGTDVQERGGEKGKGGANNGTVVAKTGLGAEIAKLLKEEWTRIKSGASDVLGFLKLLKFIFDFQVRVKQTQGA